MTYSVAVVYHSGSGHTRKLAGYVVDGCHGVENTSVALIDVTKITDEDWQTLAAAHAIIFGAPTYMGSVSAPFKQFMDDSSRHWIAQKWADKIAAGFTIGSALSGDKLNTLMQLCTFSAQHGMVWVGQNCVGSRYTGDDLNLNEVGSWLGLMATSSRDKSELVSPQDGATAVLFGRRVAEATVRWFGTL